MSQSKKRSGAKRHSEKVTNTLNITGKVLFFILGEGRIPDGWMPGNAAQFSGNKILGNKLHKYGKQSMDQTHSRYFWWWYDYSTNWMMMVGKSNLVFHTRQNCCKIAHKWSILSFALVKLVFITINDLTEPPGRVKRHQTFKIKIVSKLLTLEQLKNTFLCILYVTVS